VKVDIFDRKLRQLKQQMDVPEFERGYTRIARECLSRRERLVFSKIQEIQKEHGDEPPTDVVSENMELLQMG
jgi:hypothetical protein